jgi:hypothetical protein
MARGQRGQHPRGLRALPGKHESEFGLAQAAILWVAESRP